MNRYIFSAKFSLRRLLLRFPRLYLRVAQARSRPSTSFISGVECVTHETEVLITGLYRSGNSFSVNALRLAQDRPIRIAHHEYPTPQIVGAANMGIPALLLIRDPDDVAVSRVVSHPPITLRHALIDYIQCYRGVLPYSAHYVVADFAQVTSDFGEVIERLNDRFGTSFAKFDHSNENVRRAFELIDQRYEAMDAEARKSFGRMVARPSDERNKAKAAVREELDSPSFRELRQEAKQLYKHLQTMASPNPADGHS